MARLTDGGFVIVWADKRQDERIRAQRFGFEGEKNGPEFRANTVPGLHRVPMVACLANGNIVIGWRARSARAPSRSPADFRLEWTGGRRADNEPGHYGLYHGGARHRAVRHRPCEECIRRRNRLRNHRRASQRVRAEWRFHGHPDLRLRRAADPVLLADARAVVRWTLRAGLDANQYGYPRGRQQCQGQGFLGSPKLGRSGRPGQYLDRRRAIQPSRRDDAAVPTARPSSSPGPTKARPATAPWRDGYAGDRCRYFLPGDWRNAGPVLPSLGAHGPFRPHRPQCRIRTRQAGGSLLGTH